MSLVQGLIPEGFRPQIPEFSIPPRLKRNARRAFVSDPAAPRYPIPSDWRRLPYESQGMEIRCYYAEAKNPIGAQWAGLGMCSSLEENVLAIEQRRSEGISSFVFQIPDYAFTHDINFYYELTLDIFLRNTPFFDSYDGLARIFYTHSTIGNGMTKALKDDATSSELVDKSDHIINVSPFIAPEFAKYPAFSSLQKGYAKLFGHYPYGSAPLDALIHYCCYRFRGYPYFSENYEDKMTQYEIDGMTRGSMQLLNEIKDDPFPQHVKDHDITFLLGGNDIVAHPEFGRLVAHFMHADVREQPHWRHNAPLEHPETAQPALSKIYTKTAQQKRLKRSTEMRTPAYRTLAAVTDNGLGMAPAA